MRARLPEGGGASQILWPCTPLERGNYRLDRVYVETSSLLGFWAIRRSSATQTEIRVYPNLQQERRNLAALFLNRGTLGVHAQRQIGKGREFEKLREYQPGDSYEDIHWKATAKRGHPITKTFQLERTQEVYVVVDASRLSARVAPPRPEVPREITDRTQLERFLTASLVMGLAAERQGDLFGALVYSDRIDAFVRARQQSPLQCVPRRRTPSNPRGEPRFRGVGRIHPPAHAPPRPAGVFSPTWTIRCLPSFLRMVDLIGGAISSGHDDQPARGAPDLLRARRAAADDLYTELAGHMHWHDLREFERSLHRRGASLHLVSNEHLCTELVTQYLSVKQRQAL